MSYQRDRDEFIGIMTKEGLDLDAARKLLREGATLQRLAVAECNGDHPFAPDGPNVECSCGRHYAYGSGHPRISPCPDCRARRRVTHLLQQHKGFDAIFNGDARGAVVKIIVPSGRTNDWGREGICVPTR